MNEVKNERQKGKQMNEKEREKNMVWLSKEIIINLFIQFN